MILIVSASDLSVVNAALESAGHGPRCIRYPLSADGSLPPSHYAAEWQALDDDTAKSLPRQVTVTKGTLESAASALGLRRCSFPDPAQWRGREQVEIEKYEAALALDLTALKAEARK